MVFAGLWAVVNVFLKETHDLLVALQSKHANSLPPTWPFTCDDFIWANFATRANIAPPLCMTPSFGVLDPPRGHIWVEGSYKDPTQNLKAKQIFPWPKEPMGHV